MTFKRIWTFFVSLVFVWSVFIGSGLIDRKDLSASAETTSNPFVKVMAGNGDSFGITADGSLWAWGDNSFGQLGDGTTTKRYNPKQIIASGVQAVATGYYHTIALKTDGSLWAWGMNNNGQLGDGTIDNSNIPIQIIARGVQAIAAGFEHSFAIKTDGSLWAWGNNYAGQLGDGTDNNNRYIPKQIIASGVQAIAAGGLHSMAIKTDGSLWAWGNNYAGQLGDGTTTDRTIPKQIIASDVQAIAAGIDHSLAIKTDGSLWAWGDNNYGQLGDGTITQSNIPKQIIASGVATIAAGIDHSLAIKTDGSLWAWGLNNKGQLGDGTTTNRSVPKQIIVSGVQAIAAGVNHSFAIKTDGSLWAWGNNQYGQYGDGAITSSSIPHTVYIFLVPPIAPTGLTSPNKTDTEVYLEWITSLDATGYNVYIGETLLTATPITVTNYKATGLTPYTKYSFNVRAVNIRGESPPSNVLSVTTNILNIVFNIAAGNENSFVIKRDSSLWACGNNYYGQIGDGTKNNSYTLKQIIASGVKSIEAGSNHTLAIKTDGSLWAWGRNNYGQLGDGTTTDSYVPKQIIASGVKSVAAGSSHSLVIKTDGSLWSWGNNNAGQLGDGTTTESLVPKQIIASGVTAIAAGGFSSNAHTVVLKTDGSLWAWGYNYYGQLGDGTTINSLIPKQIMGNGVQAIAAGEYFTLALKTDGSLWTWGSNNGGALGDGTTTQCLVPKQIIASDVKAIGAGKMHASALKTDGSLWVWGFNGYGEVGDGTTIRRLTPKQIIASDVQAVSIGNGYSMAVKTDGSLWTWGSNTSGQLGDARYPIGTIPIQITEGISDNIAPIITISEYSTAPTNQDITVTASTNEGTLNEESYTFTENGSFSFIATDTVGNVTTKTVIITNIDKVAPIISGLTNGGSYNNVSIGFNEGTATLNGHTCSNGAIIRTSGSYQLIVTDEAENSTIVNFTINNTPYSYFNDKLAGIIPNTKLTDLESNINILSNETTKIFDANDNEIIGDSKGVINAATGMYVQIFEGNTVMSTKEIVVYGDVSGDGDINIEDLLQIKKHLLNITQLDDAYKTAGDFNYKGSISVSDLIILKKHLIGVQTINQTVAQNEGIAMQYIEFKGSSLGDPSYVSFPPEGDNHDLIATYKNNTNEIQSTILIVNVVQNGMVICTCYINKDFSPYEEFDFTHTIYIPSTNDGSIVEVEFILVDSLISMKTKHDTVKNSINNVR